MTRKLTLFLVCAFEIALILFVAAWTAWAERLDSGEFYCTATDAVFSDSDRQFKRREPQSFSVKVNNQTVLLSSLGGTWNTLYRECSLCTHSIRASGSGKAFKTEQEIKERQANIYHFWMKQKENFKWEYTLVQSLVIVTAELGECVRK
jgi:hypothetical protein